MRLNLPLLALSAGAFGIGVTEFTPMGMLPLIANDLQVSIPAAGLVVSAYAMGVLIGAPLMTLAFARMQRRRLLVGLMGIFTLGNLLSALADSYTMLIVARLVTSLNHGAFFGVGAVVAAGIVPPERRAAAVAAMFSGLTIATIGGVPLAAWVGEMLGWRGGFLGHRRGGGRGHAVAAPGSAAPRGRGRWRHAGRTPRPDAGAGARCPRPHRAGGERDVHGVHLHRADPADRDGSRDAVRDGDAGALRNRPHRGQLGPAGASPIARWTAHSWPPWPGLVAVLVLFAWGMRWEIPAAILIFLWGVASFALVPPLQMRVMERAQDAPNLASAMNVGAFNLGNAIGAALGGGVIDAGLGYPAVPLAGAAMAAAGLAMLVALRRGRRGVAEPVSS